MKRILFLPCGLFIFLSLLTTADAIGQTNNVSSITIREGLSNNFVVDMAQDKQGFLWFATEEGLNKLKGGDMDTYYKEESPELNGITGNELNCLLDDPTEPILWIGTQRAGLNAYNYQEDRFTAYRHDENNPHSLITDDVTRVIPASDGKLWVGTYWEGIDLFDQNTGKFTHYNVKNVSGLNSNNVWALADEGNGLLYVGHVRNGLSIIDVRRSTARNFRAHAGDPYALPGDEVSSLYVDKNGVLWVGTDKGLSVFNKEKEKFIRINDRSGSLSHRIFDIKQLGHNRLHVATEYGGIVIIDLSQFHFDSPGNLRLQVINEGDTPNSLSNSTVRCIDEDSFGNLWIGTWGGGVNFLSCEPSYFGSYCFSSRRDVSGGLTGKVVTACTIDAQGFLWVGTDGGGINLFRKGQCEAVFTDSNSSISNDNLQALYTARDGRVWMGFFSGGAQIYDPKTKKYTTVIRSDEEEGDVRAFEQDADGTLWACTSGGLLRLDAAKGRVLERYPLQNCLTRCTVQDKLGQRWVGFFGDGLCLYDQNMKEVHHFVVRNGFPSNTVNALYMDRRHRIWVATGEGLVCFPTPGKNDYVVYRREQGLANTYIRALCEDEDGNIWLSTNRGISCYLSDMNTFCNFDHHDDLPLGSFSDNAVFCASDGRLYFGSINGLCYFYPREVLQVQSSPQPIITRLEISDPLGDLNRQATNIRVQYDGTESDEPLREISLTNDQNTFTVHFQVLNYAQTRRVEYSYKLKGLSDSWYTPTDSETVTFRNLPAGHYVLQLRTRLRNQMWSDPVTLPIRVAPSPWLSWWARLIYTTVCLGILGVLAYLYLRRLKAEALYKLERQSHAREQELNNERLRFYTNITHELRTPLTLILGPLEDLQKDSTLQPAEAQKVGLIQQSALRLLGLINSILEFRKTETQNRRLCVKRANLVADVEAIGLKYQELNRNDEVKVVVNVQQENITLYYDAEVVQIVLDNFFSNALKYTEKGHITLSIYQAQRSGVNYVDIAVADTGHGISPEALPHIFERYYQEGSKHQASGTGIGLSLIKNLIDLHHGEVRVESTPGLGSTFTFSLLLDNSYPDALHADSQSSEQEDVSDETDTEEDNVANRTLQLAGEDSTDSRPLVLVVEDNVDIRDYIAASLADTYEVHVAANGKQGCAEAFSFTPDVVVSDIMMPVMDGIELCATLKKDVRTSHIPIILLTAKDSLHDKEEGYRYGADSYLTKPFSANLLHSRIENLLNNRRELARHYAQTMTGSNSVSNTASETESTTTAISPDKSAQLRNSLNQIDAEFIEQLNRLILDNLEQEKIDVNFLSDKLCMSASTLYRKMKALTGLSSNEYVRKLRVSHAEQLLLQGRYSISEIAYKVGFNNLYYFRSCFKDEFGCTPSEYIKSLSKE